MTLLCKFHRAKLAYNIAKIPRRCHATTSKTTGSMSKYRNTIKATVALGFTSVGIGLYSLKSAYAKSELEISSEAVEPLKLPNRTEHLEKLKSEEYDIIVIGGGITGAGVTLDAASRGLKVACIERDDFGSGTSGRSTKLIHGGVRYLEKAFKNLDYEQYKLVKEALYERATLLKIAPHLCGELPIMLPIYSWFKIPYYFAGSKAYDFVAGSQKLKNSYFLWKESALEQFPMLKSDGLIGAMVYYDGQHEDSRMNLTVLLTAVTKGGSVANYCEVQNLLKTDEGTLNGVCVQDKLTGEAFNVKGKVIINATGPFTDSIRKMDDSSLKNIVVPSSGVHVILPEYYSPRTMGLIDPQTSDGRVIFFLPWQGKTIAGTTDRPTTLDMLPKPTEDDINFILDEIRNYLDPDIRVRRGDVLSAWAGIRPLILNPQSSSTQELCRNHIIDVGKSNLITIAGGKWTIYRAMAAETVEAAIKVGNLKPKNDSDTDNLLLVGGANWSPNFFIRLIQEFGLEYEVAQHLSTTYGTQSVNVAKRAKLTGYKWPLTGIRLNPDLCYIEAEVDNAIDEYACRAVDVIARRTRMAFLNFQAAKDCLPKVISIMAKRLNWDKKRCDEEYDIAINFLRTMGYEVSKEAKRKALASMTDDHLSKSRKIFEEFDKDQDGNISAADLKKVLDDLGQQVTNEQLIDLIREIDIDKDGHLKFEDFLLVVGSVNQSIISNSRIGAIIKKKSATSIDVTRSGGGV